MRTLKNMMMGGGMMRNPSKRYQDGGKHEELLNYLKRRKAAMGMRYQRGGEIPGVDRVSRETQIGFDVEAQEPRMGETDQIFIDGLPVSGKELKGYLDERREGMEGQGGMGVSDALMAADARRRREMTGRERLGPGMWRPTANEELSAAQEAAGIKALLGRLGSYNSRRERDY